MQIELVHATWGGDESLIKQLEDLTPEFPVWARPLWRAFCGWLKPQIIRTHLQRTMREVDRQAKEIGDSFAALARKQQVDIAVQAAREEHPEATVAVVHRPDQPTDLVQITHPPDPNDPAQVALGFGAIELKVPFPVG